MTYEGFPSGPYVDDKLWSDFEHDDDQPFPQFDGGELVDISRATG